MDIFHWIEAWYNRKRRHSALDGLSIEEFEKNIINQKMGA
jgi:transposase InsO family protein